LDGGKDPLVQRWDGRRWAIVASPLPPGADVTGGLRDVSCTSPTFCVAVGTSGSLMSTDTSTMAQHWDGQSWSIDETLNAGDSAALAAVSCSSDTTVCMAVGGYRVASVYRTLTERYL
jgi:hypothetical protein